jgi:hypothetical protein
MELHIAGQLRRTALACQRPCPACSPVSSWPVPRIRPASRIDTDGRHCTVFRWAESMLPDINAVPLQEKASSQFWLDSDWRIDLIPTSPFW